MVVLKLLEFTERAALYDYFPENGKVSGKIMLNQKTGDRSIIEKVDDYSSKYAFNDLKRIEKYWSTGKFKEEDIVAWY